MAETAIAPPAAAPAAAAPAPAAPAAAAPAAAPAAVEAKPAPVVGSPEFFTEAMEKVPTEEPVKPAEEAKPAEAAPVVEETPEAKAAREAAAVAETPEQKAAKEAAAAEAAKPPTNQVEIDLGESIAPATLLEKIDAAPDAVKEWFNDPANPLKETLTSMARRAAIADPILREIPDVETAQRLVQTGAEYDAFDSSFDGIADTKGAIGWWQQMYQSQMGKDDKGNPVPHPAFGHFERAIVDTNLQWMTEQAKGGRLLTPLANAFYDVLDIKLADAKKAIAAGQNVEANEDIVFSIENLQRVSPKPNNKPPELTPEQKKAQEGIDREKGELAKSRAAAHTEKVTTSLSTLNTEVDDAIADQFVPALDKAGLTEFEFEQAVIQIGKALDLALEGIPTDPKSGHPYYKETKKQLTAAIERDPSVANIKALKAHELKYRNMKVGPIVKDVLRKATEGPLKRQGERQAKEKAAADASKAEPRGASSAAPAISVKGTGIADSQAAWDADPKNAGLEMPTEWHFARIMGGKK